MSLEELDPEDETGVVEYDSPEEEPIDELDAEDAIMDIDQDGGGAAKGGAGDQSGMATPSTAGDATPVDLSKIRLDYPLSLPYPAESLQDVHSRLNEIMARLVFCAETGDFAVGLPVWTNHLQSWFALKYPISSTTYAKLARFYLELAIMPGMESRLVDLYANQACDFLESKRWLKTKDLTLPWRPLYEVLKLKLFPKVRTSGVSSASVVLLSLAEACQRFFPPDCAMEMLEEFLIYFNAGSLNSALTAQAFIVSFIPLDRPHEWLHAIFALWDMANSNLYSEQWLDLLARLAKKHVDAPVQTDHLMTDAQQNGKATVNGVSSDEKKQRQKIRKDIGIFTTQQMEALFDKCLGFSGVPVGSSRNPISDASKRDQRANSISWLMKKPSLPTECFAKIFVYSIFPTEGVSIAQTLATDDSSWKGALGSPVMHLLRRFVEAIETFMHPSNHGSWSQYLSAIVCNISVYFLERWEDEQSPKCKTPVALKLTTALRRDLVLTLRGVALLGLFTKDAMSMLVTQSTLKALGVLEPNLIFPEIVERAYPALQGLLETQRTMSILTILSGLATIMVPQERFAAGGRHLLPLLEHMLPAVDVNDPIKSMLALMFCAYSLMNVPIRDVSAEASLPSGDDVTAILPDERDEAGELRQMTPEEDVYLAKLSTRGFEDWLFALMDRIFNVYSNLPEEGRGSSLIEKYVIATIDSTLDTICQQLEPRLFELILDRAYRFVTTNVIINATKPIGTFIKALVRANPNLVFEKFFPVCMENIIQELDNGASSTRSTKSEGTSTGDSTLQWYQSILTGLVYENGLSLVRHRQEFLTLLKRMSEGCKAESGYTWTSSVLKMALMALCGIHPKEYRCANPDQWDDAKCTLPWGHAYEAKEVIIDWHVPSDDEIDMAIDLLQHIAGGAINAVENIIKHSTRRDATINNDFCRNLSTIRYAIEGTASLMQEPDTTTDDEICDAGTVSAYLKMRPLQVTSGFCLTDVTDPRHQIVCSLRSRIGSLLHQSVGWLSAQDENVDSIKMTIRTIRAFLLHYGVDRKIYDAAHKNYTGLKDVSALAKRQRRWPRRLLIRRAYVYHLSRMRMVSVQRARSEETNLLILDLLDLSISSFVQIRRSAQNVLTDVASVYDGTRGLCYPALLAAIAPGKDVDQMKGALWTLGTKAFGNLAIYNWHWAPQYVVALLRLQNEQKPSIQKLLGTIFNDYIVRIPEPSAIDRRKLLAASAKGAISDLLEQSGATISEEILSANVQIIEDRRDSLSNGLLQICPHLLQQVTSEQTHWRYRVYSLRILKALVRRDVPLDSRVAGFVVQGIISELPPVRNACNLFLVKLLNFVKIQALAAGDPLALVRCSERNPLRAKESLAGSCGPGFTSSFLKSLTSTAGPGDLLQDQRPQGWLIWGARRDSYYAPPQTGVVIDFWQESSAALTVIKEQLKSSDWWSAFLRRLSQESNRSFSPEIFTLVRSIYQVLEDEACLQFVLNQAHTMVQDRDNKHKQRAAAEVLAGIIRGSKHWTFDKSTDLWTKLGPTLAQALENTSPETAKYWEDFLSQIATAWDPRRLKPVVDLVTSYRLERTSSSAFAETKKQQYVRCMMTALNWHYLPWSGPAMEDYWDNLDNPFQEVRTLVAGNLATQIQCQWHPSYSNARDFIRECGTPEAYKNMTDTPDPTIPARIEKLAQDLERWRKERQPTAVGTSTYNLACKTIFTLVYHALLNFRISGIFPFVTELLPEFFYAQEVLDDSDLQGYAKSTLQVIARWPMPKSQVGRVLNILLHVTSFEAWRIRLHSISILQVFFFHNLFLLDQQQVGQVMQSMGTLLLDSNVEVRTLAASTLSGLIRCSQRSAIQTLKINFEKLLRTKLVRPKAEDVDAAAHLQYQEHLRQRHAGVLGMMAIIDAYPYDIPTFMPDIIAKTFTHITDPHPISSAVRDGAAKFKKSHSDTWHIDRNKFTSDQLEILNDTLSSGSYLA